MAQVLSTRHWMPVISMVASVGESWNHSQMMLTWLFEYHSSLLLWSGQQETILSEHAAILYHLKANDISAAAQAMNDHLNR